MGDAMIKKRQEIKQEQELAMHDEYERVILGDKDFQDLLFMKN